MGAMAQDNMTQSAKNLVQSIHLNPAARPSRGFISIPIFGAMNVNVNNSFSYSDVIASKAGSKYLNLQSLVSTSMMSGNSLLLNLNLDILNVGFYVAPDDFINITLRGRVHAGTTYPLGLFEFISDNSLMQQRQYKASIMPNAVGWAELGIGYSRSIGNFTVGAKFKYVEGLASINSQTGVNLLVDKQADRYVVSGDYALNRGGLIGGGNNYGVFKNPGFAVDLGATWVSDDERISASVAVSDLGRIWWDGNSATQIKVKNPNSKFEYAGLGNLLDQNLDFGKLMDSVITGISNAIGIDTLSGVGYSTEMPTTFQAMAAYSLGRNLQHNVSLGFIGSLPYRGGLDYAISAGYAYRSPNQVWQLMANYTYRSNNPLNVGFGVVMTTGCFQLFLATENVVSWFNGPTARGANVRFGFNFFFGPESVRN